MTSTKAGRRSRLIAALVACFYAGAVADWWLREKVAPANLSSATSAAIVVGNGLKTVPYTRSTRKEAQPIATTGEPTISAAPRPAAGAIAELRRRALRVPIDGADVERMKGSFEEHRGGGGHEHEAVDILAPRNTPIRAVEDGTIAKLFYSKAGGTTIYQFDAAQEFCYYYAHLERYADGLREGQPIARGHVLGYVGTSGNAPPGTPHLHFAVFELTPERRWWQGRPINPYLVFR